MLAKALLGAGKSAVPAYVEDVFSTYLYTGNGSTQTITNGIDLSGNGGLVWEKNRSVSQDHYLVDSNRPLNDVLRSNTTGTPSSPWGGYTFYSNGYASGINFTSGNKITSWTFRKQPKFFDVVTYTGNGQVSAQTINHNLGSIPGVIIIKSTSGVSNWAVYHRSLGATKYLRLNITNGEATDSTFWNNTEPTATNFTIGISGTVNNSQTYVAYLFAHNAGGFGLTGTDNVISCGSFTTSASGAATVTLGYEPQFVLFKASGAVDNWIVLDNMRNWSNNGSTGSAAYLYPNTSGAEGTAAFGFPTATGFQVSNQANSVGYIYIAIRRGPMKTPTSGTSVFSTTASSATTGTITSGFPTDLTMSFDRTAGSAGYQRFFQDRLRGAFYYLLSNDTAAETSNVSTASFASNTGIILNGGSVYVNGFVHEQFRRAPGFFDVVCYTGTGTAQTQNHNLNVVPELMIIKQRSGAVNWNVYAASEGNTKALVLNTNATPTTSSLFWNNTSPTSSVFTVNSANGTNANGATYVAYLFATLAGVSKVGSYTGTGALQTINCGFAAGARFVLIKRTDAIGDWYVWDSARGITSGNDPYLLLNSTAAEVTTTNYVDTDTTGFKVTAAAPAAINASGGTFIFLAIA